MNIKTPVNRDGRFVVDADADTICECAGRLTAGEIAAALNDHAKLREALQNIRPFVDMDYKTHDGLRVGEIIDAALKGTSNE